ncbi:Rv3235 family protein [Rhodococcus pyridinivorans]|uniref:Rv3235 family protein n=1 Tax=Rhodococcus pyridinivorans TaxID=103816 RepID=UPI0021649B7C|nr:Rv3235 family protein [Rhodococcus pyridinivorans]UVT24727.1 Rv3235 family protein [Rhodococcus pyridinivorans]
MSHHTGRYVRRLTRLEPPVEASCQHPRSHVTCRPTPHDGRSGRAPVRRDGIERPAVAQGTEGPAATPGDRPAIGLDPGVVRVAETAVRLVLEVVDGRRPAVQSTTVLDPRLVATITAGRPPRAGHSTAILLRTRVRPVDADTVELFGSYGRGDRVFAFAGRMVRKRPRPRAPHRWTITTLWLG